MDSQLEAFEKFKAAGGPAKRPFGDRPRDSSHPGPMPDLYSIHHGKVVRIEDFGAFVEIPGFRRHGLVHKKQASKHFTENVSDVVSVGDKVWVKVTSLQDDKIALSMKYVSQGDGQDLDPNLIQQTGEQDRKRVHGGFVDKAPISIEQGGVLLKTACKKCGATGHLAVDCFSMGEKFDLLEDNDEEDSLIMQAASVRDKKKKEKSRDKDRRKDHKEKPSPSSSSRYKENRRGRSRSPSPRRRNEDPRDAKVESLEDALALMRSRKRKSKHRDDSSGSDDERRHHKRSSKSRRSRSRSRSRSPARPRRRSRSRSRSRSKSPKRRSGSYRDDNDRGDRGDRSDRHGHRR